MKRSVCGGRGGHTEEKGKRCETTWKKLRVQLIADIAEIILMLILCYTGKMSRFIEAIELFEELLFQQS